MFSAAIIEIAVPVHDYRRSASREKNGWLHSVRSNSVKIFRFCLREKTLFIQTEPVSIFFMLDPAQFSIRRNLPHANPRINKIHVPIFIYYDSCTRMAKSTMDRNTELNCH